ncbi:helix-turn-helix domain-containing protein [Andreprevotia chitinilytica]|uniref:helix-turn-helix domain-containing protein n=1 Tax=Andreprevotia chitinilytica TaxID=396808 RepID=UPI00054D4753|nr:helix-turn-helix transcriptional regulator [Andreprevotia chitinilytica]
MTSGTSIIGKRLKEARTAAGLSQERLGILAGIDEFSASARMNQYERGKHEPDFKTMARLAETLGYPQSYFYETNDQLAQLIGLFHRIDEAGRLVLIEKAVELVGVDDDGGNVPE